MSDSHASAKNWVLVWQSASETVVGLTVDCSRGSIDRSATLVAYKVAEILSLEVRR